MGLNPVKYAAFAERMQENDWLQATVDQLNKDADMAGLSAPTWIVTNGFQACLEELEVWVRALQQDQNGLRSFNYRVDIPSKINPEMMEAHALAILYLMRCFQKVWLRKQFSEGSTKDRVEKR